MDSVTVALGAQLEDPKDKVRDRFSEENLSLWSLRLDIDSMTHNQ